MPESTESKQNKLHITKSRRRAVFTPRIMGIFILLIIVLGLSVGIARQQLALVLTGAVFLTIWVYCLLMTLLLALIHRRRARRACIRVSPREMSAGEAAEAVYSEEETATFKGAILQLPGIIVRCRLLLVTKDDRHICHDFNPVDSASRFFTAAERGAYFSTHDEFAVFDMLGFFRFVFRLPVESGARLLIGPRAADEAPPVNARAGESMQNPDFSFQRTDNLIDHRPYIPGDDPRRINWKLFGHGGGLFVREGEFEPPPQSNVIILIDTEYDPLLYSQKEARKGVDLLCENALAAALACIDSGMQTLISYTKEESHVLDAKPVWAPTEGSGEQIAASLAWPAALPLSALAQLPVVPDNCGVLMLALPRVSAQTSAIDHFLRNIETAGTRSIELLFLYDSAAVAQKRDGECLAAAETCAALYNRRSGVRAGIMGNNKYGK